VASDGHAFLFDERIVNSMLWRDHMQKSRSSSNRQKHNALVTARFRPWRVATPAWCAHGGRSLLPASPTRVGVVGPKRATPAWFPLDFL
jgi:hypothetical protein